MPRCPPGGVTCRLSTAAGTYALILACIKSGSVEVGKLGGLDLNKGYYLYIGSAFGPGGVRARIKHHLYSTAAPHWHIDYLKSHCSLRELWVDYSTVRHERSWAQKIAQCAHAHIPLGGFGASDTRTASQLFHFARRPRTALLGCDTRPAVITIVGDRCAPRSPHRKK